MRSRRSRREPSRTATPRRRTLRVGAGLALVAGAAGLGATSQPLPAAAAGMAPLYVTSTGSDNSGANDCQSPTTPCATATHALALAGPGATIYISGHITDQALTVHQSVNLVGVTTATSGPAILDGVGNGDVSVIAVGAPAAIVLDIDDLTIQGGNAQMGGGIYNTGSATVNVTDSTITSNEALDGGGIYNAGTLNVTDSTITQNQAIADGGGIYDNAGTVDVVDSTISSNIADPGFSPNFGGGGIYDNGATVHVTDSTITSNVSEGFSAQGIEDASGPVSYAGSLFTGSGQGETCVGNTFTDGGGNVMDPSSASCAKAPSDVTTLNDADLGALAFNGGPTQTVSLLSPGSDPAVGGASCSSTYPADQRGAPRPASGCDAGAYQTGSPYTATVAVSPASSTAQPAATVSLRAQVDIDGQPAGSGLVVTFQVGSGPDHGQTAVAMTDNSGKAGFSLRNGGSAGVDTVTASAAIGANTANAATAPSDVTGQTTITFASPPPTVTGSPEPPPAPAATTTSVTVAPTTQEAGTPVTYQAVVTTAGAGTPQGTVVFKAGATVLCQAVLTSGTATCASGAAPIGTDQVAANYSGSAGFAPSIGTATLTVVGVSPATSNPTAPTGGLILAGSDGGVFAFGDAGFDGSLPGVGVHVDDIVGVAATPDGHGYWLVGADGGVFAFGDAGFDGSLPGVGVHVDDIVGVAATPDGHGYWLVGADGGVFAYGDAPFDGSLPAIDIHTNNITAGT